MVSRESLELHAFNLGKLLGNLQMLEFLARMAISKLNSRESKRVISQLPRIKSGEFIELNIFTNQDDLTQVLEKYNKCAPLELRIDIKPIVTLRDALAHGRTFGFGSQKHLRLLKFNRKAENDRVGLTLAVDMSPDWFDEQNNSLQICLEKARISIGYLKAEIN